ncbi:MAG: hypothetical protein EP338_05260 [Bacteroidetes bacterium]|nr:MAG: hypothetical protein EP338_05260 [Bacteroidota bacterium]
MCKGPLIFLLLSLGIHAFGQPDTIHKADSLKLFGSFQDDYGINYRINGKFWDQLAINYHEVLEWNWEEQYILLRNDPDNPGEGGLYSRIDYLFLERMEPYTWAYCLSAFDAPSLEVARENKVADRKHPKTGCNGYPFSRMKRMTEDKNKKWKK